MYTLEWEQFITRNLNPAQRDYLAQLYHACRAARTVERWTVPNAPTHTVYILQDDGSYCLLPLTLQVLSGIWTSIADRKSILVQEGLADEAQVIVERYYHSKP
jgi:hypothetical protein